MRNLRSLNAVALLMILLGVGCYLTGIGTPVAMAQADLGSVTGSVTDVSGAVVPRASVTVTNIGTGAQRVTTSNAQGDYAVTQLPAAEYTLTISAPGFTTSKQSFTLTIGATRTINAKLAVSGGQTEIVVTTDTTTVPNISDAQISTEITTSQVENMHFHLPVHLSK